MSLLTFSGDKMIRFRLYVSMLPFCGLSLCLSVCLSDKFMHCAQTAEDISTISFFRPDVVFHAAVVRLQNYFPTAFIAIGQ